MQHYEITEFSGKRIVEFRKLAAVMFKSKSNGFDDEEGFLQAVAAEDAASYDCVVRVGALHNDRIYAGLESRGYDNVVFDGKSCKMSGVGCVVSDFNSPFKGAIGEIYKKAFAIMRQNGQYISHLYPFDETYYRTYGYEVSAMTARWKIPVEKLLIVREGMVKPYDGSEKMQADIKSVHKAFTNNHNLSIHKHAGMWKKFFDATKPFVSGINSFVHYSPDGTPDAYMNYVVKNYEDKPSDLETRELWYTNIRALAGMLSYFGTQRSCCDYLYITLPDHVDITPIVNSKGGYGKRIAEKIRQNRGMSRIVDVEKVLQMANYKGEGSLCIKIYGDDYAPWNNDTYTVTYGDKTTVARGGTADIEMKINSFSAAILGRFDFENLVLFDDVIIHNQKEFGNIFYRKPMWLCEKF